MKRKCKICGTRFETPYFNRNWCSDACFKEIKQAQYDKAIKKAKEKSVEPKKAVKPVKPLKQYVKIKQRSTTERANLLRQLVIAFNAYIRRRDELLPCISCGTMQANEWHAGHYKTAKAHPELRFNEFNVNKQCHHCNIVLSGNIEGYRKGLIERYGEVVLKELDSFTPLGKLTTFELKELIKHYKSKGK